MLRALIALCALVLGCEEPRAAPEPNVVRRMPDADWPAIEVAWDEPVPHRADVVVRSERCGVEGTLFECALGVVNQGDKPVEISIRFVFIDARGHEVATLDAARELVIAPGRGLVLTEAREVRRHVRRRIMGSIRAPEKS